MIALVNRARRRPFSTFGISFIFSTLVFVLLVSPGRQRSYKWSTSWATDTDVETDFKSSTSQSALPTERKIHLIMPATKSNANFCKTLLTLAINNYPTPYIVAWGAQDNDGGLIGGGSHFAKITKTLAYINDEERRKQPGFDDELIFMIDSYDIWFQLPYETLLSRYDAIVKEENERVARRMGKAWDRENIDSPVIFGGGKRCSPNYVYSVACYPIPDSPLPHDLRGGNTDSQMGRNQWTSFRTRYLNSGYMIGPIGKMRPLLERAAVKLEECVNRVDAPFDHSFGGANHCYRGSDQSVFVEMFGEQELHREIMRRHHRNRFDDWLDRMIPGRAGARPPPSNVYGTYIDDYVNPSFSHQEVDTTYQPGKPYEFGIGIDYWSLLGHQTSNADDDYRYLKHGQPLDEQIGEIGFFDCPAKVLPFNDLPKGGVLDLIAEGKTWEEISLFTEICVGTVPVMIHHNSVWKEKIDQQWDKTWWHGISRRLLHERKQQGLPMLTVGIQTDSGEVMKWDELCPAEVEPELFRDVRLVSMEEYQKEQEEAKKKAEQEEAMKQEEEAKQVGAIKDVANVEEQTASVTDAPKSEETASATGESATATATETQTEVAKAKATKTKKANAKAKPTATESESASESSSESASASESEPAAASETASTSREVPVFAEPTETEQSLAAMTALGAI